MPTFFEQVQTATENYVCGISDDQWFYGAMLLAASGQGVGAAAVGAGGLAAAMLCDKPKLPPGGFPTPQPGDVVGFWDSGPNPSPGTPWIIYYSYSGIQPKPVPPSIDCNETVPQVGEGTCFAIFADRLLLRYLVADAGVCPGRKIWVSQRSVDGGVNWVDNNCGNFSAYSAQAKVWAALQGQPKPDPPSAPKPPGVITNINFNLGGVEINNDIKIDAPDFIFAPNGDFILSFPITIQAGPLVFAPTQFNFDLNITAGTGQPSSPGPDYGTKPTGGGPKPPVTDRTDECPEIPEPPTISGSWSKADCVEGEPLFTPVNWSGKGFDGVADALNKLNSVIGPWQENSYDCDDDVPLEPIFAVPISQYTGQANFEPSVTLHFYEPNELAIQAGRTNRVRRSISIPVATPPSNPQSFLDIECQYWENFEWRCGIVACRARLPNGQGVVTVNAESDSEGQRVLDAVMSRYGQTFDPIGGLRIGTGAAPRDSQGRGGLRITTTVKFHSIGYSTMSGNYGPIYPDSVMARGPSQWP